MLIHEKEAPRKEIRAKESLFGLPTFYSNFLKYGKAGTEA
jgi:hypothetical protein